MERTFDPDAVREMKAAADRDISVGGPELAAQAIRAGLVDEIHLFVSPIVVGGGTKALPDEVRVELELLAERRFGNGVVYFRYGTTTGGVTQVDVGLHPMCDHAASEKEGPWRRWPAPPRCTQASGGGSPQRSSTVCS